MKNGTAFLLAVLMAFSLCGCGEKELTEEQVLQDVQSASLSDLSSFPDEEIVSCEVTGVRQGEGDDDTWYADITFCCGIVDEFITLPIHYTYDKAAGGWTPTFGEGWDIDRTGHACPDACGFWAFSDQTIGSSFWISEVSGDTITLQGLAYNVCTGEYYEPEDDDELTGQIVLSFDRDSYKQKNGLLAAYGMFNPLGEEGTARFRVATSSQGEKISTYLEVVYDFTGDGYYTSRHFEKMD